MKLGDANTHQEADLECQKEGHTTFPIHFFCPITDKIFEDPVVAPDGRSYERSACCDNSTKEVYPNRALKSIIQGAKRIYVKKNSGLSMEKVSMSFRNLIGRGNSFSSVVTSSSKVVLPKEYYCPITYELMNEPVIDPDGNTYERKAIFDWIKEHRSSPITRNPLSRKQLYSNSVITDLLNMEKEKPEVDIHKSIRRWVKEQHQEKQNFQRETYESKCRKIYQDPTLASLLFLLVFLSTIAAVSWKLFISKELFRCVVPDRSRLGDGRCDGGVYNSKQCGYDGGDCADCKAEILNLLGDGACRGGSYNTIECGWDGGDCVNFNKQWPNCTVVRPWWIGDGYCDGGAYNNEECGYDGGDCNVFNRKYPNCETSHPWKIENKECDIKYNVSECAWDGGDCLAVSPES